MRLVVGFELRERLDRQPGPSQVFLEVVGRAGIAVVVGADIDEDAVAFVLKEVPDNPFLGELRIPRRPVGGLQIAGAAGSPSAASDGVIGRQTTAPAAAAATRTRSAIRIFEDGVRVGMEGDSGRDGRLPSIPTRVSTRYPVARLQRRRAAPRRLRSRLIHPARFQLRASKASEPRDRSAPAKRRARERVGESEGRSPSDKLVRARPSRSIWKR